MDSNEMTPTETMLRMISGFWVARSIHAAAKLGLADLVQERAGTAEELAQTTGTHAPSLYRLLRALASVGIFKEQEDARFASTPLSATLQDDAPVSLRAFAISELGEVHYPSWGELLYTVKTGEVAFDHVFGMPVWEYFAQHPENAEIFNRSMTSLTKVVEAAVLESYDFSSFGTLVDVGGGHGGLLTSVLKKYTQLKGVLFDAPQVVEGAQARLAAAGLQGRCHPAAGDFFESVPDGGDAYMMKHIIHDWNDEGAGRILRNCRRAMNAKGRLLVIDQVIPQANEPSFGKFTDLIMMVMVGGRERTAEEFERLFAATGFRLNAITQTNSPVCIIEGVQV